LSSQAEGCRSIAARTGATTAEVATSANEFRLQAPACILLVRSRVAMAVVGIERGDSMQVISRKIERAGRLQPLPVLSQILQLYRDLVDWPDSPADAAERQY
jgi:hypothetical protein